MNQDRTKSAEPSARRILVAAGREIPLGERTLVMGILNVTPDSFYDGGRYLDPDNAVERAREMAEQGADFIDVGGQSTRPFSNPVSPEQELARVGPVLDRLQDSSEVPLCIDTSRAVVARYAISRGVCAVNDVTALRHDPEMSPLVVESGVAVVLMHMRGVPGTMQNDTHYDDVVSEVGSFLAGRARATEEAGVPANRIIIDPGIGFGKSVHGNLALLAGLRELRELGYPVLVGASRKSFVGHLLEKSEDERLEGSLGAAVAAAMNGADIVRVHDVRETVSALNVTDAIRNEGNRSCRR